MRVKKFVGALLSLTVAASAFAGLAVTASAEGTADSKTVQASYSPNSTDTEIRINQKEGGLLKFDASDIISAAKAANESVSAATLNLKIASRSYNEERSRWENTNVYTYYLVDSVDEDGTSTDAWNGSDVVDWASWSNLTKVKIAEAYPSTTDSTTASDGVTPYVDFVIDVKAALKADADGIVTFAFNTSTVRQHGIEISTATLSVTTSSREVAGDLTVKYVYTDVEGSKTVLSERKIDESLKYEEDEDTYYYPAYITVNDTFYKTTETVFGKTVTLSANAKEEEVGYSPVSGVIDFQEAESTTDITNKNTLWTGSPSVGFSAGNAVTVAKTGAYAAYTVTVPSDAQYRFTMAYVAGSTSRAANIYVDGVLVGDKISGGTNKTDAYVTDIMLKKGSHTIKYEANYSTLPSLDYLVVTRIGDYKVNMENKGVSTGINNTVATSFIKNLVDISGKLTGVSVSGLYNGETKTMDVTYDITLTDANVVFGLVVNGLDDENAEAVITVID